MSRLFGLVAARPVDLSFSMQDAPRRFGAQKQNNPDGWGLGWFAGGQACVSKHALPQTGQPPAEEAAAEATSDVFIAHVRRSSRAPRSPKNTHPFASNGWLFAHSGALYPLLETAVRRQAGRGAPYEGQTDSEAFFRLLLANLAAGSDAVEAIRRAVRFVVDDGQFSGLNFLLARDGTLFAFRFAARSSEYFSLYTLRAEGGTALDGTSRDNYANVRCNALAETPAVLVCSEKLQGTLEQAPWRQVEMGELLVVTQEGLRTETIKLL